MLTEEKVANWLEKAKTEEIAYNWTEAAKIYEQVVEYYLNSSATRMAARIYNTLGYTYTRAADISETTNDYIERNRFAIKAYKEAANLFKQIKNEPERLECEAESFFVSAFITKSREEVEKALRMSFEFFLKSNEHYSILSDKESSARTLSRAALTSFFLEYYVLDRTEMLQVIQKGRDISDKAWKISKEIGNIQCLTDSLYAEVGINICELYAVSTKFKSEPYKEYIKEVTLKCEECLTFVKELNDFKIIGTIYLTVGSWYGLFGFQFTESERERNEYFDKSLNLLEKSLNFAIKANDKPLMTYSLFYLDFWAGSAERIEYLVKRIPNDFRIYKKLREIFADSISLWNILTYFFHIVFYAGAAEGDSSSPSQRKRFAEEGVEISIKFLQMFSSLPNFSAWTYWLLIGLYSVLTNFTTTKEEQKDHIKKLLYYMELAENLAIKYEEGIIGATGYGSVFRGYKTIADTTEIKDKKIKMLNAGVDALEKFIKYVDIPIRKLEGQADLGLLYEDIAILSQKTDILKKAKTIFLDVIKESFERGYHSLEGAIYEHIARLEDRFGDHTASAENYKKAQEAYSVALKIIEYTPLKSRIMEKMEYAHAWSLIESAKASHKRENHSEAIENYNIARDILKNVSRYRYEAPHYAAWALLEESEQLSKEEKQEKAIKQYEATKLSFENAIKVLEQAFEQYEEKEERERIEKLVKVAKIRINYCTARINLEQARILGKQGEHLMAAENFAIAASQLRRICTVYKIEREKKELEAVYYLCRAWENMELAEKYEEPDRFAEAANLFTNASNLFTDSKLKLLASGNSTFCQALEYGSKFDETIDIKIKTQLYPKIKTMLRKAATLYNKGGFDSGAEWALGMATYFDATWQLIRADEELELDVKGNLLGIGAKYLKSAAELFGKAGYKDKEKEILIRLNMLEKEENILVSALNTITIPAISSSTTGIVAPSCPIETGLSPRMSEISQITAESRRVLATRPSIEKAKPSYQDKIKAKKELEKIESEVGVEKREDFCIVHKGVIDGAVYICPNCRAFYCARCAEALKEKGEKCWSCNHKIEL